MAKEPLNLRRDLDGYRYEFNLLQRIPCSKEENIRYQKLLKEGGALPEGVHPYTYDNGVVSETAFYTVYQSELTEDEKREYIALRQLSMMRTIRNCILFFTALAVISLIAYLIITLNG